MTSGAKGTRVQHLPPRSEFRFELEADERLSVRLIPETGDANIFGADLIPGTSSERWYTFGDECKACITSLLGCQLELAGTASTEYLADDETSPPSFRAFANLHLYLEAKRIQAREWLKADFKAGSGGGLIKTLAESSLVSATDGEPPLDGEAAFDEKEERTIYRAEGQGPRVMILGPESSGKTSLIKFLSNCALKSPAICDSAPSTSATKSDEKGTSQSGSEVSGWWPSIVSLDPSAGAAPLPGTISLLPLSPIPIAALPSSSPAFPYGITTPTTGSLPPSIGASHLCNAHSLWVGKENVRDNEKHSKRLVDWLAQSMEKRLARDPRARCSGILVDMPGITTADAKSRYAFIQYCVKALKGEYRRNERIYLYSGVLPLVPHSGYDCCSWT